MMNNTPSTVCWYSCSFSLLFQVHHWRRSRPSFIYWFALLKLNIEWMNRSISWTTQRRRGMCHADTVESQSLLFLLIVINLSYHHEWYICVSGLSNASLNTWWWEYVFCSLYTLGGYWDVFEGFVGGTEEDTVLWIGHTHFNSKHLSQKLHSWSKSIVWFVMFVSTSLSDEVSGIVAYTGL